MAVDFQRQERVVRLLNLLAYASNHPGLTPMEIARDLGADPMQVRDDFELLFLSGVGTGPGEMIDLEYSWKGVDIIDDQGMTKPLRLSPAEASALLILLDSLETMPWLVDARAVRSAAAKIRTVAKTQAVGDAEHSGEADVASTVADALAQKRQLRITYYSASSDTTSTRHVEPAGLFHQSGATYMHATQDGEMKTFRLDRIRSAELLDAPSATTGADFDPADPFGMATRAVAALLVHPDATWLADYWDIELQPSPDPENQTGTAGEGSHERPGWIRATMRYGSEEWLVRFCLSQADRVRLVAPPSAAHEVKARILRATQALD
ncbi:WYL domain-containing protein [Corynebacterium mucifaciens]|nr:WYL domain-containing protein [Corynebacterium mucifaciens]